MNFVVYADELRIFINSVFFESAKLEKRNEDVEKKFKYFKHHRDGYSKVQRKSPANGR